jgi:predicted permease
MVHETTSTAIFYALLKLFFISLTGYVAVRKGLIKARTIDGISRFIITIPLPALIISTLGTNLHRHLLDEMALCFAAAFLLNVLGISIAYLFRWAALPRGIQDRGLFLSLSAFQNSGYLPIPLAAAVLPKDLLPHGLILIFVYMLVMGLIFWSAGIWLITEGSARDWRENIRKTANPPIITLLLGLLFLWSPVREGFKSLPALRDSLDFIGNTTIPLVMFVLGGSLREQTLIKGSGGIVAGISSLVKLAVVPACALLTVGFIPMERTFAIVLVLQAAMPAALNHIVVARKYGGNVPLTARALFVQYLLSLATIPLFLFQLEQMY